MTKRSVLPLICIYAVLSLITNFPSGFTNSTVNTATEEIHNFINSSYVRRGWSLSADSIALVQSATLNCWFAAQVIGSMFTPYVTDHFGRKFGYMVAIAVTIGSTLVQYLSILLHLPEGLILGRSLTALMSPLADACLLLYVQETSPVSIRGTASFFCEIGYGLMCVLGSILGMRSVLGSTLDRLLLVSLIPEVLSLVFLFFIPDTPKYLMIMKGDRRGAMKSLTFFQGGDSKENEEILDDYEREKLQDSNNESSSFKEVFTTWHLRQAVFLSCCVLILTLSFYPMLQSSTYFLLNSGINANLAEISSTVFLATFTVAGFVGAAFIDRFPRRMLILLSSLATNIFLVAFAVLSFTHALGDWIKYACVGAMFGYIICFGLVLGPISWFVAPEMVSQRHKATIFSICFAINNTFIAVTDFASIPLFRLIGGFSFIALFVIPSLICMVLIYLYLPETLGRETHQIVASMLRKRNKRTLDLEGKEVNPKYKVFTASPSCAALQ